MFVKSYGRVLGAALVLGQVGRERHVQKNAPDAPAVVLDELLARDDQCIAVGRPINGDEGLPVGFLNDADRNEALVVHGCPNDGFGIAVGELPERGPQRGRQHLGVPPQIGFQRYACPLLQRQALDGEERQARNQESQHDGHEHRKLQAAGPAPPAASGAPTAFAAA